MVLPTRDLVTQVRETFEAIGKGRGLKVLVYSREATCVGAYEIPIIDRHGNRTTLLCTRASAVSRGK